MRLTIDTGAIAHSIRRAWFRWFQQPRAGATCMDCGAVLTAEERIYYGATCERCEGINFGRLEKLEREHLGDSDKGTGIYAPLADSDATDPLVQAALRSGRTPDEIHADLAKLRERVTAGVGLIPKPARCPAMPPVQPPRSSDPQNPPIGPGCCGGEPDCDTRDECQSSAGNAGVAATAKTADGGCNSTQKGAEE